MLRDTFQPLADFVEQEFPDKHTAYSAQVQKGARACSLLWNDKVKKVAEPKNKDCKDCYARFTIPNPKAPTNTPYCKA
jgi:hypothetical protein